MRIGVIDIGSNTIRLLVAEVDGGVVVPIDKERVRLSLGEEIERRGGVSETSIATAAKSVQKLCSIARSQRVESLDVFLTAPGRQSWRGAIYYETSSERLARLNGIACVFEYEVDGSGKTESKLWEWK